MGPEGRSAVRRAFTNRRKSMCAVGIAAVLLSTRPSVAAGHVGDLAELDVEDLLDIRVVAASRHEQPSSEAPSAVTVITKEEIRAYGYRTLADILRGAVGFYTTYDRNYTYLGARGFGLPGDYNTRVLLLVDGTRVNDEIYGQAPIGTDFVLDIACIDRVEIVRGPGSALYGTNAFFSVINVVTPSAASVAGGSLRGAVGSAGTFGGRASYARSDGPLEWRVSGSVQDVDGEDLYYAEFDDPNTKHGLAVGIDGDQFRGFEAKLVRGRVSAQMIYSSREKRIPTASYGTVFGDARARTEDAHALLSLKLDGTQASGPSYQLQLSRAQYRYAGRYPFEYGDETSSNVVVNEDGSDGISYTGEGMLTIPSRMLRTTLGGEVRHGSRQRQWSRDDFETFLDIDTQSLTWGTFLQAESQLTSRMRLVGGLRHDRYESFGGTTNPRLAAIVSAPARFRLKLLYGSAFRAPNEYELRYYTDQGPLEPETIETREVILERPFGRQIDARVSAFDNNTHQLIRLRSDDENNLRFENAGSYDAEGFEVELRGVGSGGLKGKLRYSHVNVKDRGSDSTPPNSATSSAGANLAVPVPSTTLLLASEIRYLGSRNAIVGEVDGYIVADFTVSARAKQDRINASLSFQNAFDKAYADPGSEEHAQGFIPQDGRNLRFFVELRY